MNLTSEQVTAIKNGEAIPIDVDQTQCVLIRRDMYDKVKRAVEYDDSPWTEDEMEGLAEAMFNGLDSP